MICLFTSPSKIYIIFYHLSLKFNFILSISNLLQGMNLLLECLQRPSLPVGNKITPVIAIHFCISVVRNTWWFYFPELGWKSWCCLFWLLPFFLPVESPKFSFVLSESSGTADSWWLYSWTALYSSLCSEYVGCIRTFMCVVNKYLRFLINSSVKSYVPTWISAQSACGSRQCLSPVAEFMECFWKSSVCFRGSFVCLTCWVKRAMFSANSPKAFFSPSRAFKGSSTKFPLISYCGFLSASFFLTMVEKDDWELSVLGAEHQMGHSYLCREASQILYSCFHLKTDFWWDEGQYLYEEKVSSSYQILEPEPEVLSCSSLPSHTCTLWMKLFLWVCMAGRKKKKRKGDLTMNSKTCSKLYLVKFLGRVR